MLTALQRLTRSLTSLTLAVCLGLCLMLSACSGAGASTLSGDYVEDTVAVVHTLQSTIALEQSAEGRAEAEAAATALIDDYMSRYRPRPQVNGLSSFTTMQTALNSLGN